MDIPYLPLRDGNKIPMVGDTTFNQELVDVAEIAIRKGFHHIDCAEMYDTEQEIGIAIKKAVAQGIDDIAAALDHSLEKMQLTYFDLYLIHVPFFAKSDSDFQEKSIGVSNYLRPHLEATLKTATDPPVINQIEYHPYLQRADSFLPWMREHGIQVASFKGLTPAFRCPEGPLVGCLSRIAEAHNTKETSILLAWLIQNGVIAITTTLQPKRLDDYARALTLKLTNEELHEISDVGSKFHFRTSWQEKFEESDRA
ncbi:Aldo/keto reductase [Aaosphaeria arxii CBS 175.79]|uniref:Aldo/keto reductase n=1 Tax=Aaosphaeria arxii CBS 175.79 TaxID=1450172 RepID=A0A6A5X862_9PLEO|nr:Aldo/keto reductase [Aaosphaeria arxii CBS 175.79]KAF2009096.1 Aldo/keto reductase [Aaosphaeria arxii CBS 175.79]